MKANQQKNQYWKEVIEQRRNNGGIRGWVPLCWNWDWKRGSEFELWNSKDDYVSLEGTALAQRNYQSK